ncbi:uncharacterized protein LOC123537203 [Mercenaria mercenaria]|uniref:uncharacterized protein LOC123537203 n=1 Tax=Mercenaria mercenaria TaxID=6596 RepID=UPI00234F67EC|nr:uncharacterized protein LOC123537203 [Mercenaria mercenaria]
MISIIHQGDMAADKCVNLACGKLYFDTACQQNYRRHGVSERSLQTRYIGRNIVHKSVTVTTMNDAEHGARQGDPNGTVYIAERMTGARGTKGRSWIAESTGNLYMSYVLHMELPEGEDPTIDRYREFDIDVAGAIASLQALKSFGLNGVKVKWLNDLWITGHKLLGALTEYKGKVKVKLKEYHLYILGLGLNVNCDMRRDPAMHEISTSVMCELGHSVSREELFSKICNNLEPLLKMDRMELLKLYKIHEAIKPGDLMNVYKLNEIKAYTFGGVKKDWSVDVKDENDESFNFSCVEVSLRPVPVKTVYVVNGPDIEKWSTELILKTCNALVDTQRYEVATITTENISSENLSSCALVVIGQLKSTPKTSVYLSRVLDYIKKGGSCLTIGNACSLFQINKDVCLKDRQFAQYQEQVPSVIKTDVRGKSFSVKSNINLCLFHEYCQYSTVRYESARVLASRHFETASDNAEDKKANGCKHCTQNPTDIEVCKLEKGKICFCRPNIEVCYADIDEYLPKLDDKRLLLQETVCQRDRLFIEILEELNL